MIRLIAMVALTAFPVGAFAQEFAEPSGGYNPDMFSIVSRLRDPVVRDVLQIREDQLAPIRECHNAWVSEYRAYRALPADDQDLDELDETLRETEARIETLLSKEQSARLDQLTRASWFGNRLLNGFRGPRLRDELGLTVEQQGQIEEQYKDWLLSSEAHFLELADQEPDARLRTFLVSRFNEERESDIRRSLVDLLTEQQRIRFDQTELQWRVLTEGGGVFLDESVRSELELSESQLEQITDRIPEESRSFRQRNSAIEESYLKCLNYLSDIQIARWTEMLGEQYGAVEWIIPK